MSAIAELQSATMQQVFQNKDDAQQTTNEKTTHVALPIIRRFMVVDRGTKDTSLYGYEEAENGVTYIVVPKIVIKQDKDPKVELENISRAIRSVPGFETYDIVVITSAWSRDPNMTPAQTELMAGLHNLEQTFSNFKGVSQLTPEEEAILGNIAHWHILEHVDRTIPRLYRDNKKSDAAINGGGGSAQVLYVDENGKIIMCPQKSELCGNKADALLKEGKSLSEIVRIMGPAAFDQMMLGNSADFKKLEFFTLQGYFAIGSSEVSSLNEWGTGLLPLPVVLVIKSLRSKIEICEMMLEDAVSKALSNQNVLNILDRLEGETKREIDVTRRMQLIDVIKDCKTFVPFEKKMRENSIHFDENTGAAFAYVIDAFTITMQSTPAAVTLALLEEIVSKRQSSDFMVKNARNPTPLNGGKEIKNTAGVGLAVNWFANGTIVPGMNKFGKFNREATEKHQATVAAKTPEQVACQKVFEKCGYCGN